MGVMNFSVVQRLWRWTRGSESGIVHKVSAEQIAGGKKHVLQ